MDSKNPLQESEGGRQRYNEEDHDSRIMVEPSDDDNVNHIFRNNINENRERIRPTLKTGRLSPSLPDTIEFAALPVETRRTMRLSKTKKRTVTELLADEPKVAYSKRNFRQNEVGKPHRHVIGQEQTTNTNGVPVNDEFLLESLFVLLYLRRSTTVIPITIPLLHSTEHPILLTMASYPFRVLFSNGAHQNLCGSNDAIGRTLFDCFESDEDIMNNPSLASYPNFLKLILDGRPCYINTRNRDDGYITAKVCTIKAEQVFSKVGEGDALQYYAIHFIVAAI